MYHFDPGSARDISTDGRWFRDAQGRFALFRGVNFGPRSKLPPYLPILPLDLRELTPDTIQCFHRELDAAGRHLDLLKDLGFNIVRLLVSWKALEPWPNPRPECLTAPGRTYLTLVVNVIDALYTRGLFVVLDFHQDLAHELCGGDGFPDWALAADPSHPPLVRPCIRPDPRWGINYYSVPLLQRALGLGTTSTLVRRTLRSFWDNDLTGPAASTGYPIRSHLVQTVGATARFLQALDHGRGHPAILGYEPFNEPHPAGIPRERFEQRTLPAFYREALAAIRGSPSPGTYGDSRAFLFVEPRMDWTTYAASGKEYQGARFTHTPETYLPLRLLDDIETPPRAVFSFHYYDPWTIFYASLPLFAHGDDMRKKAREWPETFRQMREAATLRRLVPFLTEFGAGQDWPFRTDFRSSIYHGRQTRAYMDLQFQQVEAFLLNATYWTWDLYHTPAGRDNWNREDFSLLGTGPTPRDLDIVARPYPMRSASEPTVLSFDLETRHCAIVLDGRPVAAPTVIYVPHRMHYAEGFEVRATDPTLEWDAAQQLLYWTLDPHDRQHLLVICPAGRFRPDAVPLTARPVPMDPHFSVGPL